MVKSVAQVAGYLGASFEGDGQRTLVGVADLKAAGPDHLTFLAKKQFSQYLASTQAVVIVGENDDVPPGLTVIRAEDPYFAYAKVSGLFVRRTPASAGIHPSAVVSDQATVHPTAKVGPNCVIEAGAIIDEEAELQAGVFVGQNSRIGAQCLLYANVSIYHDVTIGIECTVHACTVIGSDGFGFAPSTAGWEKIHQLGGVEIGDRVEIGANTAIDRGAVNPTVIGNGVIIDNQVHIAHNVQVGDYTAIAGCVGIAGSAVIGQRCTFGGGVAINGHITIADNVHVNGGSVVTKSLTEPGQYASGTPLQEAKSWRKNAVRQGQLSDWVDRIKKLEQSPK